MANGFEIMLKSMLGIDPQEFRKKLEEGMALLKNTLSHFDKRMLDQEEKFSKILEQNEEIMSLLKGQNHVEETIKKKRDSHGRFLISGERSVDATDGAGQSEGAGKSAVNDAGNT